MVEVTKLEKGYLIQSITEDNERIPILAADFTEQDIKDLIESIITRFVVRAGEPYFCNEEELYRLVDLVADECNIWEEIFTYDEVAGTYALEQDYGAIAGDFEIYSSEGIERLKDCIKDALVKVMLKDAEVITIEDFD